MGKASSAKRARSSSAALNPNKAKGVPLPWISVAVIVIVLGVFVVVVSRGGSDGAPTTTDHWHAALGVNVCGTYAPDAPEFELRNGSSTLTAGIHSHGNGLIHIHPHTSSEAGKNATVGRFFEYGGWDLSSTGFKIWTGEQKKNGDKCPDGKPGRVVWSVQHAGEKKAKIQKGNPADYHPKNLDVIAIGFLPEGEHLGTPPSAATISAPGDVPASPTIPTPTIPTTGTSAPTGTPTSAPPTTAPAGTSTP